MEEQVSLNASRQSTFTKFMFEIVDSVVPSIVIIAILLSVFFRVSTVEGQSMQHTLEHGDRLLINTFLYEPKNGDIVVIDPTEDSIVKAKIIKRVIAVAGQSVKIDSKNNKVYVDNQLLDEPYISSKTKRGSSKIPDVIPEGYIFVMGDNREHSSDSRSYEIGLIHVSQVVGKAVFRFFPFNSIGGLY